MKYVIKETITKTNGLLKCGDREVEKVVHYSGKDFKLWGDPYFCVGFARKGNALNFIKKNFCGDSYKKVNELEYIESDTWAHKLEILEVE